MRALIRIFLAGSIFLPGLAFSAEEWQSKSYSGGDQVCLDGNLYEAKWWAGSSDKPSPDAPTSVADPNWGQEAWLLIELNAVECGGEDTTVNTAPIVVLAPKITVQTPTAVTLDASGSYDEQSDALTYQWTQIQGLTLPIANAGQAKATIDLPSLSEDTSFIFEVAVSDGTSTASRSIIINARASVADNHAPVANAGADFTIQLPQQNISLNASASTDPDGDNLTYHWTQISGPQVLLHNSMTALPYFSVVSLETEAQYIFEVKVSDGVETAADRVTVTLKPEALGGDSAYQYDIGQINTKNALEENTVFIVQINNPSDSLDFECSIPAGWLLNYQWPYQLGKCVNGMTDTVKIGEKRADTNLIAPLQSSYRNRIWAKDASTQFDYRIKQETNQQGETVEYQNNRLIRIKLDKTQTKPARSSQVLLSDILELNKPAKVDLSNISITDNTLTNNTPYTLNKLNLALNNNVFKVTLEPSLPAYSKANIATEWTGATVINSESISNSVINYQAQRIHAQTSNSRYLNDVERSNSEKAQIYDRFMMNSPESLNKVTEHLKLICNDNSTCKNYGDTAENYAIDTYFAKSVSAVNTDLWIDNDVWGLATASALSFIATSMSENSHVIWMHPTLMGYMATGTYSKQIEGWQALIHEYYHNHGFGHADGWPSANGIDDLFGKKVVDDYLVNIGTRYIPSDIVTMGRYDKTSDQYIFELYSDNFDVEQLSLRLLSTDDLRIEVTQNNTNQIKLKFLDTPVAGVYLSFFTDKSPQMSTVALDFTVEINTKLALGKFNENIAGLLSEYDIIYVSTADGAWAGEFYLPSDNVQKGKIVSFTHKATFSSSIYHDGLREVITTGEDRAYEFNGTHWEVIDEE
ncbi:PKD domain-containing protein [Microbulbifer sp. 2201CG32-9]|uniref:PKD domain-containing protein n=1 Tax=Microbulbifer sp. 2201CG32-9 TaxID=3232309 RepID=UPI00345BA89B